MRGATSSAALASAEGCEPEPIAWKLDPGNVVGSTRLPDLMGATLAALEQRGQRLSVRLDAGYGVSHSTLDTLLETEVGFVLKWRDLRVAKKVVREHQLQWQRRTRDVRVADRIAVTRGGRAR